MDTVNRRSVVLTLVLLAGLALLGRWLLVDDAADAPSPESSQTATYAPPAPQPASPSVSTERGVATAPSGAPAPASLATLRGRVVDAVTRLPVREFEVAFQPTRGASSAEAPGSRAYQADDGRFEWRDVTPGTWLLTVSARGYQRFELEGVLIAGGDASRELIVPMRAGHVLRGRVYDEVSGIGVAAAQVSFREAQESPYGSNFRSRARITTGKDGAFTFEGLPPGRIILTVGAQKYAGRELEVLVSEEMQSVEIGLVTGALIEGRLVAADGVTPVAGEAGLYRLDRGHGGMGRTGPSGEFRYENLEAGAYRLIGRSGNARVEQEITLAPSERMEGVALALKSSSSIRGVVSGLRPEELKQVGVTVQRDDGHDRESFMDARVDRNGAFEIQGVAPGRVRVIAELKGRRQVWKTIQAQAGADATVELTFERGARLSGRVTRGGQPLANTYVMPIAVADEHSFSYGARTSARGEYVVDGLTNGEYRVRVEGYPSRFVHVSGDTVFNIDLPTASLLGRVLEERGDAPIVGADVELRPAQGARYRWIGRSDHLGKFNLQGVEPGDFILTVFRDGYDVVRERISYSANQADAAIRLRRSSGVQIRIRPTDGRDPPSPLFVFEVLGDTKGNAFPIQLDAQGVGALPNGFAGGTLSFEADGYEPAVVRNWGGERLDLQLARAAERMD